MVRALKFGRTPKSYKYWYHGTERKRAPLTNGGKCSGLLVRVDTRNKT